MSRSHRIYFPITVLLIASIACAVPAISTVPDTATPIDLNNAIAQTVAALTLNAPTETSSPTLEPTVIFTFTPSLTPTETATPTLEFTSTPSITLITVSVDTNCRSGPGKVYPREGSLLIGETAEVLAVDPTTNYWYIRNPDASNAAEYCWVWGEYATLTGPTLQLPIHTPPPTPTATATFIPTNTIPPPPTFNADYVGVDTCNGQWWVNIKLKNSSSVLFKSVYISIKDKTMDITQVQLQNEFSRRDGCGGSNTKDSFGAGETYIQSSPLFGYNLSGHEIKATITICSDKDLNGICSTRGVGVIIP